MAKREFPDPSLPVTKDDLWGFTYGEQTIIRRRRKEWLAANAAIVEAEKMKHARTCQICGRPIFAETGVIAHHGYRRPFEGYQTASCFGARHLPFEKSRDRLGEWIDLVTTWANQARIQSAKIRAGQTDVPLYWIENIRVPGGKRIQTQRTEWCKTPEDYSWAQAMKFAIQTPYYYRVDPKKVKTFEQAREEYAQRSDQDAAGWESERGQQTKRYDAWVQTEK